MKADQGELLARAWIHRSMLECKTANICRVSTRGDSHRAAYRQGGRCGAKSMQGDREASYAARCHRDGEVHGAMESL